MAHDVFISYASKDKVVADAVCAALEADHIRCYIAPRDVLPGQRYAQALVDAIHNAKAFVLVFSAASNASNQVEREVDRAVSCGLPILPLRVEDVMPSDWLEYYLAGQHWLDALTPPLEAHLSRLSEAIGVLLQPPAAGARVPLKDEWREASPAPKPAPSAPPAPKPAPSAPPASDATAAPAVEEKPDTAAPAATPKPAIPPPPVADLATPAKRPAEYVPPRPPAEPVRPPAEASPATPKEASTVKPTPASTVAKTESPAAPPVPPPAKPEPSKPAPAKPAPAAAKPVSTPAAPTPTHAKPVPKAPATAPATSSAAAGAARAPVRQGRRTAVIAAALVGALWVGVLLAVELLSR